MAYDASNNKEEQQDVSGANPLGSAGGATPSEPVAPTTAPTPEMGTGSAIGAQQQQATNKKAPKASSGMFTNIQKYVQKNQPQAQKMSQAVTKDVGEQATDIRKQAEAKQAKTQGQIAANTAAQTQQKDFAQQQVSNIMSGATPSETQEADNKRFQDLMAGKVAGTSQVQGPSFAAENVKAQALGNLAAGARTEEGRKNLLRGTFGDQGKQYTRGMSGLDQLILGGDKQAREGLIGGIQGQAKGLQEGLTGMQQATAKDVAAQQLAQRGLTGDINQMVTGAQAGLDEEVAASLEAEKAKYGAGQQDFIQALTTGEGLTQDMLDQYLDQSAISGLGSKLQSRDQRLADWAGKNSFYSRHDSQFKDLDKMLGNQNFATADQYTGLKDILNYGGGSSVIQDAFSGRDYSDQGIKDYIMSQAGQQDMSGLFSASDPESIQAQDIISQEQLGKFQALERLSGDDTPQYLAENVGQRDFDYGTTDLSRFEGLGSTFSPEEMEQLKAKFSSLSTTRPTGTLGGAM